MGGAGDFGGYNGGAAGGTSGGYCHCTPGFAGGGASDVRQGGDTLSDRVIVAAGGGGAGGFEPNLYGPFQLAGGPGGGLIGGAGDGYPSGHAGGGGGGGTQKAGGTGGTAGSFYGYTGEPGQAAPWAWAAPVAVVTFPTAEEQVAGAVAAATTAAAAAEPVAALS